MNRAVSGADCYQVSAAVDFATHFIFANLAFGGDWELEIDVSVAGVQVDVGSEVTRNLKRDVAVAGLKAPSGAQRRAVSGTHFDVSVPVLRSSSSKRPRAVMCLSPV